MGCFRMARSQLNLAKNCRLCTCALRGSPTSPLRGRRWRSLSLKPSRPLGLAISAVLLGRLEPRLGVSAKRHWWGWMLTRHFWGIEGSGGWPNHGSKAPFQTIIFDQWCEFSFTFRNRPRCTGNDMCNYLYVIYTYNHSICICIWFIIGIHMDVMKESIAWVSMIVPSAVHSNDKW